MVNIGSGGRRQLQDVRLSRYACYLVVQNGDPAKPVIANGQTHYEVGTIVRETIKKLGGTMPEDLPVAEKGAGQLEKEINKRSIEAIEIKT